MTTALSMKKLCLTLSAGTVLSMAALVLVSYAVSACTSVLVCGGLLILCTLFWLALFVFLFSQRLSLFTADLCQLLDDMLAGGADLPKAANQDTLLARINHRLLRLYDILQDNHQRVSAERQELQELVSDISHQIKTPISNLKMVTETLLNRPVSAQEQQVFLQGLQAQIEKLDFLFQAMVKSSRLETGSIQLSKQPAALFDTLAQAASGIVYPAECKQITVTIDCPEDVRLNHDSKWTAEALFNLLDNAVKYTSAGGKIAVSVLTWEMYVRIDVADTGKGIAESQQAAIFRRFYREESVHMEPGIGIGLYLAREIITRQGGYIKVTSAPGQGAVFSVFLPYR